MSVSGIQWLPWGADAFEQAHKRNVPILLSIGAVWCHWCHVMDQTTYSDARVAKLVGQLVIPVRVDNDQRPDINARYNMGGWPTTAFLTPDGEVLAGGTYMAPDNFVSAIQQISDYYQANKSEIANRAAQMKAQRLLLRQPERTGGDISLSVADSVYQQVAASYDEHYGGFGAEPKFPQVDALELALERHSRMRDQTAWGIVGKTLRSMAKGGMYDHEMGGFFRYSTTRDWSVPHFEKMLEDNARLLSVYLQAFQVGGEPLFRETAEGIIDYVSSTLYSEAEGYFYGSQDADERYYSRTRAERAQVKAPFVDTVAYTAWNAMMVRSYLKAGFILERPELMRVALGALELLWQRCWTQDKGVCQHWRDEAHLPGWLPAQSWAALACLDAYEATGEPEWLARGLAVLDWMLDNLTTPSGALRDMPEAENALGRLAEPETPLVENGVAAEALIWAGRLTGREDYRQKATAILVALQGESPHWGIGAAGYARAVEHLLFEPLQVVMVGKSGHPELAAMRQVVWQRYLPNRVLLTLDPDREQAGLRDLGFPTSPWPRAYVCVGSRCLAPTSSAQELESTLAGLATGGGAL